MTHVHTREQGLKAIRALGYDVNDRIMSVLITADEISVRRLTKMDGGGFTITEDRTILNPRNLKPQEHAVDVGPLDTSPEAGQGG